MKKRLILFSLGLLFLTSLTYAQSIESKLQAALDSIYAINPTSVGIMAHVESSEQGISWSGAIGLSNKNAKLALEPDQPGLIASSIKTYVSATILRLVEKKKLSIHQPIKKLLSNKTRILFEQDGYDLDSITIKHLLSHTSGIANYANQEYIDFISKNQNYRWNRNEQLKLTIKVGSPLSKPGTSFSYTDANYLLLTEIIENMVNVPFYTAMRELLKYESLGLRDTWFPTLEEKPAGTKPLVHQYWGEHNWDSHAIDVSVDLYGGGGIACTTKDLARFSYNLFNANIIEDTNVLNLIFTEIQTKDSLQSNYYLGLSSDEYRGLKAYGHGGFWGTVVLYFPKLNTSISVFVLERDKRKLRKEIMDEFIEILITTKT